MNKHDLKRQKKIKGRKIFMKNEEISKSRKTALELYKKKQKIIQDLKEKGAFKDEEK